MILMVCIWYLALCILVGCVAYEIRGSFWGWMIICLFFSPLIGLLLLIALGRSSIASGVQS